MHASSLLQLCRVAPLPRSRLATSVWRATSAGSGKTYTMLGDIEDLDVKPNPYRGMTPCIFEFLFTRIQAIEVNDVSKEMDLDIIKQNSQVERIIADRISKDNFGNVIPEYLVKEKDIDIAFAQHAIDEYKAREAAMSVPGKLVDLQRKKSKELKLTI
ncbi:P-loop containing nucleoside triphosphate hydrolase [Sesbania bispinosa]|nr:P-loop containing nucleoside triphosphate hydrolase [Sesbania bispinosa]